MFEGKPKDETIYDFLWALQDCKEIRKSNKNKMVHKLSVKLKTSGRTVFIT